MRVLITGAAGSLGQALLPGLAAAGHEAVALDLHRGPGAAHWVDGDVTDPDAVADAMGGVDIVVHAAALHGIHLQDHPPEAFHRVNLTGTFEVWEAAVRERVRGVVFASTMGVYGTSRVPAGSDQVAWVDEELPLAPTDVYGWTKVAGEELCRYHARAHRVPSIALRFGMFVPEPFIREGIRYLYGGVHVDEVRDAVLASIGALDRGRDGFTAVNVESGLPFTDEDAADLRADPLAAIERRYPGGRALLAEHGITRLLPVTEVFRVDRLRDELGVVSRHGFGAWLAELRHRPGERATADPAWP